MASFQAKTGWDRPKKGEIENYRSDQFLPNTLQGIPKKIAKKFKKLKNTILAPFQAKIGWERPRKRENKNYCSDQFLPDPLQRIPKKQPKNSKNSKTHYGFFSGQKMLEKPEK